MNVPNGLAYFWRQASCSKSKVSAILETRGYSSVGRASALQADCRRFEPVYPQWTHLRRLILSGEQKRRYPLVAVFKKAPSENEWSALRAIIRFVEAQAAKSRGPKNHVTHSRGR
jgi:hypothetical protein